MKVNQQKVSKAVYLELAAARESATIPVFWL
jgi:hypothetical protein